MIKIKEDLLNTCIENDKGELLKMYLGKCREYGIKWGGIDLADLDSFMPTSRAVYVDDRGILYQSFTTDAHCLKNITKLTLSDFEEEKEKSNEPSSLIFAPENKQPVPKYKYTPFEVESVFDLKEHLENGKLFYGEAYNEISHEWKLINLLVEDKHKIYLREEVKWQDKLKDWANKTENHVSQEYNVLTDYKVAALMNHHPENFLEMCRVALRATGEIV